MDMGYQTPWPLFLTILGGYVALSLVLGASGVYFKPFVEPPEEKDATAAATKAQD